MQAYLSEMKTRENPAQKDTATVICLFFSASTPGAHFKFHVFFRLYSQKRNIGSFTLKKIQIGK
jgi:hypothetical protein